MAKNGMLNREHYQYDEYQYDESLNIETVYSIFNELFPDRKVAYRKTLTGRTVIANINKFNCIMVRLKPMKDKSSIIVASGNENTVLGSIFLGGLVGYFLSRNKGKEMQELFYKELDRRFVHIEE